MRASRAVPHRLVIAHNDPAVLNRLRTLIASAEFQVVGLARDGAEAFEVLHRLRPDIALLDIDLPELIGAAAFQRLQNSDLLTKVIFLCATLSDLNVKAAVSSGAWGVTLTDDDPESLLRCISEVAAGRRYLPNPAVPVKAAPRNESAKLTRTLTAREKQIAELVAQGLGNKEISRTVNISEGTVKIHLHNIYGKLGISNRTSLAMVARQSGGTD